MATGSRSTKQVQQPGAAQATASENAAQNNPTSPPAGDGSQVSDSSQQQAGALGHPDAANTGRGTAGTGETKVPETVTLSKEHFELLMQRIERLESAPAAQIVQTAERVELPDAKDVDVTKITTSVLTKQGWVVPPSYGSHPNQK